MILHKVYVDGSVEHEVMTRAAWESALGDPAVESHWTHADHDCHDIAARHWSNRRKTGPPLFKRQHDIADADDPTWVGNRGLPVVAVVRPAARPVAWPPEEPLTVWALQQLTTMCKDEVVEILRPKKQLPPIGPRVDKRGQLSLF